MPKCSSPHDNASVQNGKENGETGSGKHLYNICCPGRFRRTASSAPAGAAARQAARSAGGRAQHRSSVAKAAGRCAPSVIPLCGLTAPSGGRPGGRRGREYFSAGQYIFFHCTPEKTLPVGRASGSLPRDIAFPYSLDHNRLNSRNNRSY